MAAAERILVVDDSATQLEALRTLLADAGFDVETARSGEAAIDAAHRERFSLVLSDVVMPGISGYDLCRRLKSELAEPPLVILLTSLSDPRDIMRGVECGADNYITKPYDREHLLERLQHVRHNAELRNAAAADAHNADGAVPVSFLGEMFHVPSDPQKILSILLSSFEDLIRTNTALDASRRAIAEAHTRELRAEQQARERAEADTRRMEALKLAAEKATHARDEVLGTVSHDLRNPVGTIYTSASLLLEMELPPESQRRQIEIIRRTAAQMNRLIQDLLDVSRIESGVFSVEAGTASARTLVLEAFEAHSTMAENRNVELAHHAPDESLMVHADRDRVLQVFSNVIGNALRFTGAGGRITIDTGMVEDSVAFRISDTGSGIDEASLPHIFDRFWHSGQGGSGLGLAIARGIVEAHGGRIWAESSPAGTTFTFTLPVAGTGPAV